MNMLKSVIETIKSFDWFDWAIVFLAVTISMFVFIAPWILTPEEYKQLEEITNKTYGHSPWAPRDI